MPAAPVGICMPMFASRATRALSLSAFLMLSASPAALALDVTYFDAGVNNNNYILYDGTWRLNVAAGETGRQRGLISQGAGGGGEGGGGGNSVWGLEKIGDGKLILIANNTYTGLTRISAGTLQLGDAGGYYPSDASGMVAGNIDIASGARLIFARNDNTTYAGATSGNGGMTKLGSGTLSLTGTNLHFGGTTITEGTLQIGAGGTSGSLRGAVVNNAALAFNRSDDFTYIYQISGTGSVTQRGAGTLTMTSTHSYTGATHVDAGTLLVNGSIASSSGVTVGAGAFLGGAGTVPTVTMGAGGLKPGDGTTAIGTLNVGGNLNFASNSTYYADLSSIDPMSDLVLVSGNASLNNAALLPSFTAGLPGTATSYKLLTTTGTITGTFNASALAGISNRLSLRYDANNVYLDLRGTASGGNWDGGYGYGYFFISAGNSWHNATKWSTGAPPDASSDAVFSTNSRIDSRGTAVHIDSPAEVKSLIFAPDSATYDFNVRAPFTVYGGVINQSGTVQFFNYNGEMTFAGTGNAGNSVLSAPVETAFNDTATALTYKTYGTLAFRDRADAGAAATIVGGGVIDFSGTSGQAGDNKVFVGAFSAVPGYGWAPDVPTQDVRLGANILTVGGLANLSNRGAYYNRHDSIIAGTISGTGGLVVTGAGSLTLSGASTYTGGTTVNSGATLALIGAASIKGAVVNNGELKLFNTTVPFANDVSGTGRINIAGGTAIVTGNLASASTNIDPGTTLQIGNGGASGALNGAVVNNGALVFNRSDDVIFNTAISGSGSLTQAGAGKLFLTGNNTYSGGTIIDNGALVLGTGGTSGSVAGDIAIGANGALAVNRSNAFDLNNILTGSGSLIQAGSNVTTVSGANTGFIGAVSVQSGTLNVTGSLTSSTMVVGSGATLTGTGDVGNTTILNGGTLTRPNDGALAFGTLELATNAITSLDMDARTSINSRRRTFDMAEGVVNGTLKLDFSGSAATGEGTYALMESWDGRIAGRFNQLTVNGLDSSLEAQLLYDKEGVYLDISKRGTSKRELNVLTRKLDSNKLVRGLSIDANLQLENGVTLTVDEASGRSVYSGTITGGSLRKTGEGDLVLNGESTIGKVEVTAGKLVIGDFTGSSAKVIGDVSVTGATIKGAGTVAGTVTLGQGGTAAPGNSIGTLNTTNVAFGTGSIYEVEVNADGRSDKINASGTAALTGGTVTVVPEAGTFAPVTTYRIIDATGGVSGTFADVTGTALLDPTLIYGARSVDLRLVRTDVRFASYGSGFNQVSVGNAISAGGAKSALYIAAGTAVSASAANGPTVLSALSGEVHATLESAQLDTAVAARRTLINRMRSQSVSEAGWSLWGNVTGNWGSKNSDGNAARATSNGMALTLGADTALSDHWRVGLSGAYVQSDLDVAARASTAKLSGGQFGAYLSGQYDAWAVRTGFGYGTGRAQSQRAVAFAGLTDALTASQDTNSQQVFGEIGYGIALPQIAEGVTVEPFAGLAWTRVHAGAFREAGGAAALSGDAAKRDAGFTTIGAQLSAGGMPFGGGVLTPGARLGWQHAFANPYATRSLTFISSGQGFAVRGTPLDGDRAVVDIDAGLTLGGTSISIGYAGSLSARAEDHGIRLRASVGL